MKWSASLISNDSTEFFSDLGFYYVSVCEKFQEIDVKIILLGKMGCCAQLGKTCKDKNFDLIYMGFLALGCWENLETNNKGCSCTIGTT